MKKLFLLLPIIFFACKDGGDGRENAHTLKDILESSYIKKIDNSSWEKINIVYLNDNKYKIIFSFISTGKTKICTLYSKGRFTKKDKDNLEDILWLTPEKIKDLIAKINVRFNEISVHIDNMDSFIENCGDFHQFVNGEYMIMD